MAWKPIGQPDRPAAARQVGRAGRRHRHRDRQDRAAPARHLRLAAVGAGSGHRVRRAPVSRRRTATPSASSSIGGSPASVDVSNKTRLQYEWAAGHIRAGIGGDPRRPARPRATWPAGSRDSPPAGSSPAAASRSSGWCSALRSPTPSTSASSVAARPPGSACLGSVAKTGPATRGRERGPRTRCVEFLAAIADHRWGAPMRLAVLYGLRRSELLGLHWSRRRPRRRHRADRAGPDRGARPTGVERRQERPIPPHDPDRSGRLVAALTAHRTFQAEERLAAGGRWIDHDLVVADPARQPRLAWQLRPDAGAVGEGRPAYRG